MARAYSGGRRLSEFHAPQNRAKGLTGEVRPLVSRDHDDSLRVWVGTEGFDELVRKRVVLLRVAEHITMDGDRTDLRVSVVLSLKSPPGSLSEFSAIFDGPLRAVVWGAFSTSTRAC